MRFQIACAVIFAALSLPTGLARAQTDPAQPTIQQQPVTPENHFFDSNGVRIRYIDEGDREAEPVVLVHGFSANIEFMWSMTGIVETLARDYRVIALDCRGHGQSGKPHEPEQYGPEMINDVVRLLDHLEIDKAHIVGYSMGGMIAFKMVTDHPDRVISAIPAGFAWDGTDPESLAEMMTTLADALENEGSLGPLIEYLTPDGEPKPSAEEIKQIDQMITAFNDTKALAACARGSLAMHLEDHKLQQNTVPCLAIVGGNDPIAAGAEGMKERMANLDVHVVEGADHMSAFSIDEFLNVGLAFLKKHARTNTNTSAASDR